MLPIYLSIAAATLGALALVGHARRRPPPAPAPVTYSLAELFEMRQQLWDARTPLGELQAPTLDPWPPDEAAQLLAAWADQRAAS